jgi:hypothetical protein
MVSRKEKKKDVYIKFKSIPDLFSFLSRKKKKDTNGIESVVCPSFKKQVHKPQLQFN